MRNLQRQCGRLLSFFIILILIFNIGIINAPKEAETNKNSSMLPKTVITPQETIPIRPGTYIEDDIRLKLLFYSNILRHYHFLI